MDYDKLTTEELFEEFKKEYYKASEIANDSLNTTNSRRIHDDLINLTDLEEYGNKFFLTSQQTEELSKFIEVAKKLDDRLTPTAQGTSFVENFILEHNEFGTNKTGIKEWEEFSAKAPDDISKIKDKETLDNLDFTSPLEDEFDNDMLPNLNPETEEFLNRFNEADRLRREAEEEITDPPDDLADGDAMTEQFLDDSPDIDRQGNTPLEELLPDFQDGVTMPDSLLDIKDTPEYRQMQTIKGWMNKELKSDKFAQILDNRYSMYLDIVEELNLSTDEKQKLLKKVNDDIIFLDELYKDIVVLTDAELSLEQLDAIDTQLPNDLENYKVRLQEQIDDIKLENIGNIPDLDTDEILGEIENVDNMPGSDPGSLGGIDPNVDIPDDISEIEQSSIFDEYRKQDPDFDEFMNLIEAEDTQVFGADDRAESIIDNASSALTPDEQSQFLNLVDQYNNIADQLPIEQQVKKRIRNRMAKLAAQLTTPSGILDLVDIWETVVFGMGIMVAAAPEIKRTADYYFKSMGKSILNFYGMPSSSIEREDVNWEHISNTMDVVEYLSPTDRLIKMLPDKQDSKYVSNYLPGFQAPQSNPDDIGQTFINTMVNMNKNKANSENQPDKLKETFIYGSTK